MFVGNRLGGVLFPLQQGLVSHRPVPLVIEKWSMMESVQSSGDNGAVANFMVMGWIGHGPLSSCVRSLASFSFVESDVPALPVSMVRRERPVSWRSCSGDLC